MTKSEEILHAIAYIVAEGKTSITFSSDWDFGTATIEINGEHTHVGAVSGDCFGLTKQQQLDNFINDLHNLLVNGRGLSWAKQTTETAVSLRT